MPTLVAGVDYETKRPNLVDLTPSQMDALGLEEDPRVIGCGTQACAYDGGSDRVVKITADPRDAVASWMVAERPQPWAIPVEAVHQLAEGLFAIVVPFAGRIPADMAAALDKVYQNAAREQLVPSRWPAFRDSWVANAEDDIRDGCPEDKALGRAILAALPFVDEAMLGFRDLGLDWVDFHPGNWGMYGGRPVVIDLGMSKPLDRPPVGVLAERAAHRRQARLREFAAHLRDTADADAELARAWSVVDGDGWPDY